MVAAAAAAGRRQLVVGNWKMNGSAAANAALLDALRSAPLGAAEVSVCVPALYLHDVAARLHGSAIHWGAQDCSSHESGAYTGEISAAMLAEFGCSQVIVGHSERRAMGETDEQVARKAGAGLKAGLATIICVGEQQEQHDAGQAATILTAQVTAALAECSADDSERLVLAYEPVWAIGTGKNADPEHAYKMMRLIRDTAAHIIGAKAGLNLRVIYGDSVNGANIEQYVELPQCDGCLVGGASLKAEEFAQIVKVTSEVYGHR